MAGGLGGVVTEFLAENHPIRVIRVGMNDRFGESGQASALMHKFGLDAAGIVNRVLEEIAKDDLGLYIRKMGLPFDTYPKKLYDSKRLYEGYDWHDESTFENCHDTQVYRHYIAQGKRGHEVRETLARALHDHFITHELYKMLVLYDEKDVIGVMGGHAKRRDDPQYRQIVFLSKRLTEMGRLMVTGGGPGAMEAAHLGAWMAGRSEAEVNEAVDMLIPAPTYQDEGWLRRSFEVMERFPLQTDYRSLAIPTYYYGHEPTGTMQEIFQDAGQNHYESEGYASPMIFMGKDYYTHYMPAYSLLKDLSDRGVFKNMILTISDDNDEIIDAIVRFREEK